jgi:hypothetical protein
MTSPFQFSLRSLMLLVVTISVLTGLITMPYVWSSAILLLISLVIPPALAMGFTRGGRDTRFFCAGAFLPASLLAISGVFNVCQWLLTQAGSTEATFDWLMRRFFIRDQCLIMFGLAILSGTVCLLIQQAAKPTVSRSKEKGRGMAQPVFRIMLQFGATSQRNAKRKRRAGRRHRYELSRRVRGNSVLVRAEYLQHD